MGTRRNDDGTTSFVSVDPALLFFPVVASRANGKRSLIIRDRQHEYVFVED